MEKSGVRVVNDNADTRFFACSNGAQSNLLSKKRLTISWHCSFNNEKQEYITTKQDLTNRKHNLLLNKQINFSFKQD